MKMRRLGTSGLKVSEVGLGCNNFGMRIDAKATDAGVGAAIDAGITLFDTADIYGGAGASEELMGRALEGILRAAAVTDAGWGDRTAVTLPGLTTTPRDMAAAMDRVVGYAASDLIDWTDDPVIGAIVGSWPARFETRRAHALGLRPDRSFDDVVREYISGQRP